MKTNAKGKGFQYYKFRIWGKWGEYSYKDTKESMNRKKDVLDLQFIYAPYIPIQYVKIELTVNKEKQQSHLKKVFFLTKKVSKKRNKINDLQTIKKQ